MNSYTNKKIIDQRRVFNVRQIDIYKSYTLFEEITNGNECSKVHNHEKRNVPLSFFSPQYWSHHSFRGSVINGGGGSLTLPSKLQVSHAVSDPKEIPPKVPPRKESISPLPAKPELPIQLISTTNQVHKPAAVQQQIPTKLAALSKAKEKGLKGKISHQRTQSAGNDAFLIKQRINGNL